MTTSRKTKARRAANLAATADARALTNALVDSHGHNATTVDMSSMAGTKYIFANKAGNSLVKATCCMTGFAASAAALASTPLTTATASGPGHDDGTNETTPNIVTMDILDIEAVNPTNNAALTAMTMSMASGHEQVCDINNDYALSYSPPLGVLYTRWNRLKKHHLRWQILPAW